MADATAGLLDWVQRQPNAVHERGLSEEELAVAEQAFRIEFPPLWRSVLAEVLLLDGSDRQNKRAWPDWPDWRLRNLEQVQQRVAAPVEGLLSTWSTTTSGGSRGERRPTI